MAIAHNIMEEFFNFTFYFTSAVCACIMIQWPHNIKSRSRHAAQLTWEIPDSNSSGFSPLGLTILALVLNMAFVSGEERKVQNQ